MQSRNDAEIQSFTRWIRKALAIFCQVLVADHCCRQLRAISLRITRQTMEVSKFLEHEVTGLGLSTGAVNKGVIRICKSRYYNEAFYDWLLGPYLIEFVAGIKIGECPAQELH